MTAPSAERLTVLLGLLVVMLATLPRYVAGGHDTRLSLMSIACVAIAVVAAWQWRQLEHIARQRVPALLSRLGACLLTGLAALTVWHALMAGLPGWELLLSHGTTAGLLLHVLSLWWRRETSSS